VCVFSLLSAGWFWLQSSVFIVQISVFCSGSCVSPCLVVDVICFVGALLRFAFFRLPSFFLCRCGFVFVLDVVTRWGIVFCLCVVLRFLRVVLSLVASLCLVVWSSPGRFFFSCFTSLFLFLAPSPFLALSVCLVFFLAFASSSLGASSSGLQLRCLVCFRGDCFPLCSPCSYGFHPGCSVPFLRCRSASLCLLALRGVSLFLCRVSFVLRSSLCSLPRGGERRRRKNLLLLLLPRFFFFCVVLLPSSTFWSSHSLPLCSPPLVPYLACLLLSSPS